MRASSLPSLLSPDLPMKQLLDNGTLVTLGLVGVVAAVGAANKAGYYGSTGSAARSTGSTRLRTLPFTFVNATAEESKGMFHPPQVIRIGKKRIVTPAGSGDDVDAYVYGDNVLVVVSNSRMPYYGATLYTDDGQGGYRVDQDVFLQGQEEVVDALGKRYDSLRDLTIANKLLAVMS